MRRSFSACVATTALVLLLEASPSGSQVAGDFVLTTGRAGRVELGTSVDEVYQMFGRDNVSLAAEFREGMFSPVLKITLAGSSASPAISTDIREWPCGAFSVWGIDVRDDRFRTKEGFGVGSNAGELRRAHPFKITEEEGAHAAIIADLKMTFSLTRQGPVEQQRVTAVWIWPDPEAVKKKRCPGRIGEIVEAQSRPPSNSALQLTSGENVVARLRARRLLLWPLAAERGR
jgi:hypothetical protein